MYISVVLVMLPHCGAKEQCRGGFLFNLLCLRGDHTGEVSILGVFEICHDDLAILNMSR